MTSKYNVHFSGKTIETTVTIRASSIDDWVREVRSINSGQRIIAGLDCEWRCIDKWELGNKVAMCQHQMPHDPNVLHRFHSPVPQKFSQQS
ncbi:hypothetical protein GIB67_014710 [Kingdonia uniflora]|uniref:Uncharacterized protein n=1 Tax=Kingdonia uniflora TaxID=39325 RepID=A0A7J7NUW5_9MAGN|nr:hypothetical protein GIB67_014710 [Kingdonia uniflora]